MRANLQLCGHIFRRIVGMQCGTVSTAIDGTANHSRMVGICSHDADRYRFGIGAELLQGRHRIGAGLIIDVTIDIVILVIILVGIGI